MFRKQLNSRRNSSTSIGSSNISRHQSQYISIDLNFLKMFAILLLNVFRYFAKEICSSICIIQTLTFCPSYNFLLVPSYYHHTSHYSTVWNNRGTVGGCAVYNIHQKLNLIYRLFFSLGACGKLSNALCHRLLSTSRNFIASYC